MNPADVTVIHGDSREKLKGLAAASVDSCVCDPPYALVSIGKRLGSPTAKEFKGDVYRRSGAGFMGKTWDTGETAFDPAFWREVWRVLKPGAWVVAFGGTRTYHRLACAIEDGGFEIRDQLAWLYGSGFPKSMNLPKAIDRAKGAKGSEVATGGEVRRIRPGADQGKDGSWEKLEDRAYQPHAYKAGSPEAAAWEGWGTALKPALEPIILARKPLDGTVAGNVLKHGTGALNIDGCRVESAERWDADGASAGGESVRAYGDGLNNPGRSASSPLGRWPANVVHDGSAEVVVGFPANAGAFAPVRGSEPSAAVGASAAIFNVRERVATQHHGDSGSAARFFYSAKADADDRIGSAHPTVKPVDLMAWLCRLVTPPGGTVLDPFAGSGTTGEAALREGFRAILIEREDQYVADIHRRIAAATGGISRAEAKAERHTPAKRAGADLPLFMGGAEPCSAD